MKIFGDLIHISILEFTTAENCSEVFYNERSKYYLRLIIIFDCI